VTARITIVLAMLAGVVITVTVLSVLWRSAARASAASETRYASAHEKLDVAENELQTRPTVIRRE
jgi:ABC-type nickel/cobalt efflux system permease component RcnA